MQTTTLRRPEPGTGSSRTGATPAVPTLGQRVLLVAGAAAVLGAGGWSLTLDGPRPAVGPDELVVDRGVARVEQVVSAARPQHAMPGMGTDDDPVADGDRRVSIDVTLRAPSDDAVDYDAERFSLSVSGAPEQSPHRSVLPGEELPPGTSLSGTLVFDVPKQATEARLSYDGGTATSVVLPPEAGASTPTSPADSAGGQSRDDAAEPHSGHG